MSLMMLLFRYWNVQYSPNRSSAYRDGWLFNHISLSSFEKLYYTVGPLQSMIVTAAIYVKVRNDIEVLQFIMSSAKHSFLILGFTRSW